MKKIISLALLVIILLTSCTSAQFISMVGPCTINGVNYAKFYGSSDPLYGYEKLPWGSTYENIKEKTGWSMSKSRSSNGVYFIGDGKDYYPHGEHNFYVNKTKLYFMEDGTYDMGIYKRTFSMLYAAEDEYKNTPTMDFLHQHYGDFSEENVVSELQKQDGIEAVYKGKPYLSVGNFYGLEIHIYENGKTIVNICDPFIKFSNKYQENWACHAALDTKYVSKIGYFTEKRINFTFLNQNKDGNYLFIGYSKGYENPSISYVRAGICWSGSKNDKVGVYDIKGDTGSLSKNYSIEKWKSLFDNKEYFYTYLSSESSREILTLFLESENIKIRHNNTVSEFKCDYEQLKKRMAEYGITWEELDEALMNEEF